MKTEVTATVKTAFKAFLFFGLIVTVIHLSCSGSAPNAYDRDGIVIAANLYTGRAVEEIRLSWLAEDVRDTIFHYKRLTFDTITFQVDTVYKDTVVEMYSKRIVEDAEVSISCNGNTWPLLYTGTDGWYHEPTRSLIITAGQTYRLDVISEGRHAWAKTTVPPSINGLVKLRDSIYVTNSDDASIPGSSGTGSSGTGTGRSGTGTGTGTGTRKIVSGGSSGTGSGTGFTIDTASVLPDSLTSLTIKWDNPENKFVFFVCEPDPPTDRYWRSRSYTNGDSIIFTTGSYGSGGSSAGSSGSGSGSGTGGSYLEERMRTRIISLRYPGRYKFTLLKPTDAFWKIFYERSDTTSLIQDFYTRSFSNINDGVGFLASFSIDSLFFYVVQ